MLIPIEERKSSPKNPTAKEFSVYLVQVRNFLRSIPPSQLKLFLAKNQPNQSPSIVVSCQGSETIITIKKL